MHPEQQADRAQQLAAECVLIACLGESVSGLDINCARPVLPRHTLSTRHGQAAAIGAAFLSEAAAHAVWGTETPATESALRTASKTFEPRSRVLAACSQAWAAAVAVRHIDLIERIADTLLRCDYLTAEDLAVIGLDSVDELSPADLGINPTALNGGRNGDHHNQTED